MAFTEWRRWSVAVAAAAAGVLLGVAELRAEPVQAQATCRFVLGFGTLRELASPLLVGGCLEDEHHNPSNGDALQVTSGGLLVWRKADNWTAFTNGAETWINGPLGLTYRLNTERFDWEADAQLAPRPPATGLHCGTERWGIKTLSDAAVSSVDLAPRPGSVASLRALTVPRVGFGTPRIPNIETVTYTLQATLLRMAREDDHDIHVVIAEPGDASQTMIVELPDPGCAGVVDSARRAEMAAARRAFELACGQAVHGTFTQLSGNATLTGVAFVDVIHGQSGVAPNGIELHPVLRVEAITCSRA
jgi:hypothetical protein